MIKYIFSCLALIGLIGCEEYTSLEETGELVFVTSQQDFRAFRSAFPAGSKFELVQVAKNRKAVWIGTATATAVGGGMGVSTQNKNGLMLDQSLCSTGEMLVNSIGINTIHPANAYPNQNSPAGVCFKSS